MQPDAEFPERVEQLGLDPTVEHRVRRLVDQEWRSEIAEDRSRLARVLRRVRRDPGVQRLTGSHGGVERAHRLLERRVGVEAMRVEDVDVVEPHPREALVEAREEVLARAVVAIRSRPHVVAGLRRDDELVPEGAQVLLDEHTEVLLRRAVRRPVVVCEVEMGDPQVECAADDGAARLERTVVPEVPPQTEGDCRQKQSAAARPAVVHPLVAVHSGHVRHRSENVTNARGHARSPPAAGLRFQYGLRAVSSAGRAPALHAGGRGFESLTAHKRKAPVIGAFHCWLGCSRWPRAGAGQSLVRIRLLAEPLLTLRR